MAIRDKSTWMAILFIFAGLVIGGLLGELSKNVEWLWWLSYGEEFGLTSPVVLDLNVIKLSFSCTMKISIASIIGLAISIFIYRRA